MRSLRPRKGEVMSDHPETPLEQMAHLATEMTEAALAGQAAGLKLLQAEMEALAQLLPGGSPVPHQPKPDTETEADFDNMPV